MKREFKNIIIKISSFLLIGMIALLIANKTFYLHTHKLSDGTIVIHSHPYEKTNNPVSEESHHHSNILLHFSQNLSLLFFIVFLVIGTSLFLRKTLFSYQVINNYTRYYFSIHKGRAPPLSYYFHKLNLDYSKLN
ncbi:MAG: hypothetical protein U9R54_06220 [Bacteroidota bacterium]|nr:hypothetical protein [Bacteroidota bacterium]